VDLLRKGIGIHHAGMQPILREIVEILFAKGCIKMLFCTTSVAIGLNLPVKTCIFTDVCKHDGERISILQGHEYVQAAGRSGRLGIDTVGNVIHLNNLFRNVEYQSYKTMLKGRPQVLSSKFKISYNLLLNLIDIGDLKFTDFANKSMIKEDLDNELLDMQRQINKIEEDIKNNETMIGHMKTPIEIVKEYLILNENQKSSVNKKRREIERRIQTIVDEYKFVEKEKEVVIRTERIQDEYYSLQKRKTNIETFLENNVQTIIELLEQDGFVQPIVESDKMTMTLTKKGVTASNLRECHCLIFSNMMEQQLLEKMSAIQMVSLFSCFTNVSVNEEQKQLFPKCNDEEVQTLIKYVT
jgi:superfamily II RNA helicase